MNLPSSPISKTMDLVAAETKTAPSISSDDLDDLVAEADRAKLKA